MLTGLTHAAASPQTSNKTRMTSVYMMAASLVRNKPALLALLSKVWRARQA